MLPAGRYLLGVAEILLLVGSAGLAATAVRRRLVPGFSGAMALLASLILSLALLIWCAELLGSFAVFEPLPYLLSVGAIGIGIWALSRRLLSEGEGGAAGQAVLDPPHPLPPAGGALGIPTVVALAVAAAAILKFGAEVKLKLGTGMTGFDTTWYHGPFAAGFFQTGDTWELHRIAPQFLTWFYPANSELFHAIGMGAFDRDLLSPLLNLGWFAGCLLACWCLGRGRGVAPWSLALGAVALSVPAFSDQAGEARNDVVGLFFLLAASAVVLAARPSGGATGGPALDGRRWTGAVLLAGLAAGLAAGTKLNFLPPAAVLVVGVGAISPPGRRTRNLGASLLAALAGGAYWYVRNLVHTGNPLPWYDWLGLPTPDQPLGGRQAHSVLGYLTDGSVWSDWFLPGLHDGLWAVWPALLGVAALGLLLNLGRSAGPAARVVAIAGLATALAWLVAPTSASGPEGVPRGFESGLRYLVPALVLGLATLPIAPTLRDRLAAATRGVPGPPRSRLVPPWAGGSASAPGSRTVTALATVSCVIVAAAVGYLVQRSYLRDRYASPSFAAPGLNAAFRWATPLSDARIATTSTRQYPLFGTDLSNRVDFVGEGRPHGGFVAPTTCRAWRRLLDAGRYDYVVTSRDRVEAGRPAYPPPARWTEGRGARVILATPPTKVFELSGTLDPSTCPN
jgi:hypothetical protein